MTILEKQFYNESILLEQVADIENRILDEEMNRPSVSSDAHRGACEDSGVQWDICLADDEIQGGLL